MDGSTNFAPSIRDSPDRFDATEEPGELMPTVYGRPWWKVTFLNVWVKGRHHLALVARVLVWSSEGRHRGKPGAP